LSSATHKQVSENKKIQCLKILFAKRYVLSKSYDDFLLFIVYQAADASSHYASNHHQSSIAGMQALHVGMQIIALTSLIAMLGTLPVQKIEPKTDTHTERERERERERDREREIERESESESERVRERERVCVRESTLPTLMHLKRQGHGCAPLTCVHHRCVASLEHAHLIDDNACQTPTCLKCL